jgi:hypothetical protein
MRSPEGGAMASKRSKKCRICGDLFICEPRNRKRQKYCPKHACKAAAKAARQRRWLGRAENRDYFRGAHHVQRVREWRAAHPFYWRRHGGQKAPALQDALAGQPIDGAREIDASIEPALQDALRSQGPVLIGLIAHLSDSALQADIAATSRRLLQLGQDILGGRRVDAHQTSAAP